MKHIAKNKKNHSLFSFICVQIKTKLPKGVEIVGISAGRFHSVFYTNSAIYSFGLNAGQIGELTCCVGLESLKPCSVTVTSLVEMVVEICSCSLS